MSRNAPRFHPKNLEAFCRRFSSAFASEFVDTHTVVIIKSIQESVRSKVYVAMDFSNKSQGGRILDNPR